MASAPPLPNLTVQQLEYLVAVSRAGTWAEAAADVGVTPSALSQGLAELERRVGVPLFGRDGRRRVLTPAGQVALDHATAVVARTADLARWAAGLRAGTVGQVRIGMIDAAAVHHFPDVLRRFRRDHPGVELHLTVGPSSALLVDLSRAALDLVVCVAPPQALDGITTTPLMVEPLRVYAPPGADADAPAREWGPWVTFPAGSHSRRLIAAAADAAGAPFVVVAESHQPEVLREMVRLGIGWTVLPVAQAEAGADPMVAARRRPLTERTLVLARRSDAIPDATTEALAAALGRSAAA